jgi:hypothetical protein
VNDPRHLAGNHWELHECGVQTEAFDDLLDDLCHTLDEHAHVN